MILLDIFDSRKRANISIFVMIFRPSKNSRATQSDATTGQTNHSVSTRHAQGLKQGTPSLASVPVEGFCIHRSQFLHEPVDAFLLPIGVRMESGLVVNIWFVITYN